MSETRPYVAIVGTDTLGRPFTRQEKAQVASLLRAHDLAGASLVALRFALKLRRNTTAAQDLLARAQLRLLRTGWDPNDVPLVKRLCRLVWSEYTNELSETDATRRAESVFLSEQGLEPQATPSAETLALRIESDRQMEERATAQIESLRAAFTEANDEVNLLWLRYTLDEVTDLGEMARRSGRDVAEFYRAADRRKRHIQRWLAAQGGVGSEEET